MDLEMTYNHMPKEYYFTKELSSSAKLVLERLWTLSKDATQPVYARRGYLAEELGLSKNTITKVFRELIANGYVEETERSDQYDRTRIFTLTAKLSRSQKLGDRKHNSCEGVSQKLGGGITKNVRGYHKKCDLSLDGSIERNKERESKKEHSLFLKDFKVIFSQMVRLKDELKELYNFELNDLQEDARSLCSKFKGEQLSEDQIRNWMIRGYEFRIKHQTKADPEINSEENQKKYSTRMHAIKEMLKDETPTTDSENSALDVEVEVLK